MRMTRPSIGLVAVFVLSFSLIGCQPDSPAPEAPAPDGPPPADQVLMNGKILTVDADFSVAQAVAIQGDRIVAVGTDESLAAYVGDATEVLDLEGRTVVPGLIDNHMHFIRAVQRWNLQARIDGINIRQDALDVMAE